MAKLLTNKTGCLEAGHKRCEELAAILWIQLKINGSCRRDQKELFVSIVRTLPRNHPIEIDSRGYQSLLVERTVRPYGIPHSPTRSEWE